MMLKLKAPVLWPPYAKSWLIGKDSDAGRDWEQKEKGMTEDEMAWWHHWLDERESEWTLGVGDGQGGLACCDSWALKKSDMTEWLNWTDDVAINTKKTKNSMIYDTRYIITYKIIMIQVHLVWEEGKLDSISVLFLYTYNNKILRIKLWKLAVRKMFTYRSSLPSFPNLPSPFQPGFCYFLTLNWIFLSKILYFNKILIYFSACIL